MNNTKLIIQTAIAGLIAVGTLSAAPAMAAKGDNEKCAGIVKAGKNDCGTSKNSCAGQVATDGDKEAWIYVPKGTCEKLVGGTVVISKK